MKQFIPLSDKTLRIGRGPSSDLFLDLPGVSRSHAELSPALGGWLLRDLGSTNGTLVNGKPVTQQLLKRGDVISIATAQLTMGASGLDVVTDGPTPPARPPDDVLSRPPRGTSLAPWYLGLSVIGLFLVAMAMGGGGRAPASPEGGGLAQVPGNGSAGGSAGPTDTAMPIPTVVPKQAGGSGSGERNASSGSSVISLFSPALGDARQGDVPFAWKLKGSLGPEQVFDLRVCRGSACQPTSGVTNTRDEHWAWCPDKGEGTYRWQVVVIDGATKKASAVMSPVAAFDWNGGCSQQGADRQRKDAVESVHVTPVIRR